MSRNPEVVTEVPTLQELLDFVSKLDDDLTGFVLTYVTEDGHGGSAFGSVSGIALAQKLANRYADQAFQMAVEDSTVEDGSEDAEPVRRRIDN